jgi:hypothetical protein
MVLPGLTVIFVYSFFFHGSKFAFWMFKIFENSWLSLIFILVMSYFIGILFIGISDCSGFFKTYYTDTPEKYQKRAKETIEKIYSSIDNQTLWEIEQKQGDKFFQIRERYIIFTQSCGNFAWACITSVLLILISDGMNNRGNICAVLLLIILFLLSLIGYAGFRFRQRDWDDLIIGKECTKIQLDSKLYPFKKRLELFMNGKIDWVQLKSVIIVYAVVGFLFLILAGYLWWTQGSPPYYRDAGVAVVGGIIGSMAYAALEKVLWKRDPEKQQ